MASVTGLTFLALCLPFLGAIIAPAAVRYLGHNAAWPLALFPALAFLHFAGFLPSIAAGQTVQGGFDWVPSLCLRFSWLLDGLSLTFALLITGIGALIVLYAGGYLKGHVDLGSFFSFIFLFMGSMLGLVVSDSFLTLFVFWELTSITSFLLIGFDHQREAARRAALQALVVTGGGGLLLLAGLLLIWQITGAADMSGLLRAGGVLRESPLYLAALILILGGAFTKSAQFPFHFWLPNAMEAPTPVSAYLHSATMVKAGVYLLMRLNPAMGGTMAWQTILPLFGAATLLVGTLLAIRQTDLKLKLAYTTVSSLGLLVLLTGFGSDYAIEAAVLYLVAHSLFKGALFMVAGIVDHETGTRDITRLGGLRAAMPLTFAAAIVAAVSMGGLPPAFGFLAKEEIYAALAEASVWSIALTIIAVAGNALMFAIAFAVALKPFLGARVETPRHPHEAPPLLWLGPVMLAVLGLIAALFSGFWHAYISSPMASAVGGKAMEISVSLVPHIGVPLLLSALTVLIGVFVYWKLDRARFLMSVVLRHLGPGPDRGFDGFISGLVRLSHAVSRVLQPGRLEIYIAVTFLCLAAMLLVPPVLYGELPAMPSWPDMQWHEAAIFLIAIIGLGAVVMARDRLTAIVSLGIQGFAVAVIFLLFGAPDLSFTQFMVETLSVVILALVMTRLRLSASDRRPPLQMLLHAVLAAACGLGFGLLLLKATQAPFDLTLTAFFNQYSKLIAHGTNVVNVIIVDFRGTDTLGEIAVVTITGLAILALIRIRAGGERKLAANDPDLEEKMEAERR
ncbi:putative monovalent cation/H+ antiporter subunit A [Rhizobium rhizogenes]|uniref:putative monovalent cation/H+ antiporter subunit A n=1 Tax=Rhizobium rhizogenes TaxID=359 RepID=UPI0004D51832|nr:putative monovalent cation/H+ antiporter subunit A [Rhizobium rhizogenes]KEA07601.1 monovalent cation/H+ antiporter subunit A [Rhizobium rhizogenes]MQB28983.1 putative monovalent cation/H+ antiporter subunit A [Rhizobium rhizogenes]NTF67319.1 putative monovalent cation/H+ antiporter subunit A [Rhizobium rhizogenes]NTG06593.1 putative monovalent cation/H+ antiporter subunit A [Rhizobium rhizogenes]NTI28051.1 putative monovalent cation/H+ antiporter subunit A [Rhizobium rhizogenes]